MRAGKLRKSVSVFALAVILTMSGAITSSAQQLQEQNKQTASLAQTFFVGSDPSPLPLAIKLDRSKLDYSIDSLKVVDAYVLVVHNSLPKGGDGTRDMMALGDKPLRALVMLAGVYVGEVMRRQDPKLSWYRHENWVSVFEKQKGILGEPSLATVLLVGTEDGAFSTPLNKVMKFLRNGEEDSLWFFAQAMLARGKDKQ